MHVAYNIFAEMKSLLFAIIFFLSSSLIGAQKDTVYISTGCAAYAYHKTDMCYHLRECKQQGHVEAVSLKKAESMDRKPCSTCYKLKKLKKKKK